MKRGKKLVREGRSERPVDAFIDPSAFISSQELRDPTGLVQTKVPEERAKRYEQGRDDSCWTPLKEYPLKTA